MAQPTYCDPRLAAPAAAPCRCVPWARRVITALLLLVCLASAASAQATGQAPTGGRQTERGWNPGTASESLAFGGRMAVLGMGVVFAGLVFVYLFLVGLRRALDRPLISAAAAGDARRPPEISAEVAHAIALALFMDLRAFDEETAHEVTIRKITRPFSPWMDSGKTRVLLNNQLVFKK